MERQETASRPQRRTGRRTAPAFSLVEVMVVVVIIGLLAGAVALKVGGYLDTANQNRVKSDIATIKKAIDTYHLTHNRYPSVEAGIDALPIENKKDPWGNEYGYNAPASRADEPYEVFTLGEDGREGGDGAAADVYSWQLGGDEEG